MTATTNLAPSAAGAFACSPACAPPTKDYYATRVATVILVRRTGEVVFIERDRWVMGPPADQAAAASVGTSPEEKAGPTAKESRAEPGVSFGAWTGPGSRTGSVGGVLGAEVAVLAPSSSGLAQRMYRFRLDV